MMIQNFTLSTRYPPGHYLESASTAKKAQDYGFARRMLRAGLRVHPACAEMWYQLAKSLQSNPDWSDETLRCYKQAYDLNPGEARFAMRYASFLSRKNQHNAAEEIHISILADEGYSPRLLCAMGHGYQHQKKWSLALACFDRARDMDPADDYCAHQYARACEGAGRPCNDEDRRRLAGRVSLLVERQVSAPLRPKVAVDNPLQIRP